MRAAGLAIGVVGDAGVRAVGQQPAFYVAMILVLIFVRREWGRGGRGPVTRRWSRDHSSSCTHDTATSRSVSVLQGEALGLYGLIVALILSQKGSGACGNCLSCAEALLPVMGWGEGGTPRA